MRNVKSLQHAWFGIGLAALSAFSHPIALSLGLGAIATLSLATPAAAAVLTRWQFNPTARQLEITVPEGVTPRYFLLAQPARIVLDLPNTTVGSVPESQTYSGAVRQIRVGEFQPGLTRIVIELSPDAVLAAGQVELRQVEGTAGGAGGSRWVLRPLLQGDAVPVATQPQPQPVPTPQATPPMAPAPPVSTASPATTSNSTATLPSLTPAPSAPPLAPAALPPAEASAESVPSTLAPVGPASPSPVAADSPSHLPPLEPNALEIPIDPPDPPRTAASPQPSAPTASPLAASPQTPEPAQLGASSAALPLPSPAVEPATEPDDQEARSPTPTPLTSSPNPEVPASPLPLQAAPVPSMRSPAVEAAPAAPPPPAPLPTSQPSALPPSSIAPSSIGRNQSPATVQVPPLSPSGTPRVAPPGVIQPPPSLAPPSPTAPRQSPLPPAMQPSPTAIAAQPTTAMPLPPAVLPTTPASQVAVPSLDSTPRAITPPRSPAPVAPITPTPTQQAAVSNPAVLLPSGTVLNLRYPRDTALQLQTGAPWQEVLVVAQDVRDRSGAVVIPAGSQVIGRFETSEQGSRFIAQAITVQGRNVQLRAESAVLMGDRQVSDDNLVRNSAIGGAAFTVLGILTGGLGFLAGALAGAAAGAATTYITAPQPAIIQPNQVVEVRLSEDVPKIF